MPEASQWWVFAAASLVLLITPGPAVLYVVTRSLDQGRMAGLASVAGVAVGTMGHVLATTFGLAALLNASPLAFAVVKWAGAAYLVWVGVRRMLEVEAHSVRATLPLQSLGVIARQGVVVNLLNPKTALFFVAFLPQFARVDAPLAPQLLLLGLTFVALGVVTDVLYALLAGGAQRAIERSGSLWWARSRRFLVGGVFVLLGVSAAWTQRLG
jgi:threonine/homoserine/homoserine lactone efflux protein